MKKTLIFAILMLMAMPCSMVAQNYLDPFANNEAQTEKEGGRFARRKGHLQLFYNTTSFKDFKHHSRYGAGFEWTSNYYVGLTVRETMNFGLDSAWTGWQELKKGYTGAPHWYLTTDVGPNLSFFFTDHIGIVVPFLFSFRYMGNASSFYPMKEKVLPFGGEKKIQYALAYMMTPSVNIYLKHLMLSVGVDFEVVPTGWSKEEKQLNQNLKNVIANCGLHLGIGFGH